MRSASDAGDGKHGMSPCPRVCPVFGQPLMVSVGFAECSVQSSCFSLAAMPKDAGPVGGLSKQGKPERGLIRGLCRDISDFCTSKERFPAAAT